MAPPHHGPPGCPERAASITMALLLQEGLDLRELFLQRVQFRAQGVVLGFQFQQGPHGVGDGLEICFDAEVRGMRRAAYLISLIDN